MEEVIYIFFKTSGGGGSGGDDAASGGSLDSPLWPLPCLSFTAGLAVYISVSFFIKISTF
jgi:hypothetical protein